MNSSLERTSRVPTQIIHADEIALVRGTPALQRREYEEKHKEEADLEANTHFNLSMCKATGWSRSYDRFIRSRT